MIVHDHDMPDRLATYDYKSRPDREASLLSSRGGIGQPVGSNHHHSFLKRSKTDVSQNVKFLSKRWNEMTSHLINMKWVR
jgi:hypothetical protein